MFKITICICTFCRPQSLKRLLESLQHLAGPAEFIFEVVIVDNDAEETARNIAKSFQNRFYSLKYCVQPQQNIAMARNLAVQESIGEWIAFIDDDEVAHEDWLSTYWQMIAKIPCDGFFGPVLPKLESASPPWMDKEIFFSRPRFATGTLLNAEHTRTGNAFVLRSKLKAYRFNPNFGLTGGEDSELFTRMLKDGANFYWCDEAVVFEYIPPERLQLRWLLQRSFRGGNTYTIVHKSLHPQIFNRVYGIVKATVGLIIFTIMLVVELICGPKRAVKRMMRIAVQAGHLCAFFNVKYQEYKVKN